MAIASHLQIALPIVCSLIVIINLLFIIFFILRKRKINTQYPKFLFNPFVIFSILLFLETILVYPMMVDSIYKVIHDSVTIFETTVTYLAIIITLFSIFAFNIILAFLIIKFQEPIKHKEDTRRFGMLLVVVVIAVLMGLTMVEFVFQQSYGHSSYLHDEKYQLYSAELIYNNSFSASALLDSLTSLNYTIHVSGPYISIYFKASLTDINASCPIIYGHMLRDGSSLTQETEFYLRVYSHNDNKNIDIWYDKCGWGSPFTNVSDSKVMIEQFAYYVEKLIYQKTSVHGNVQVHLEYIGPVA